MIRLPGFEVVLLAVLASSSALRAQGTLVRILQGPQSITVSAPAPAELSVTVSSQSPVTFQWRKNGVDVPGAHSSSLTYAPSAAADSGSYDVIARNAAGSVTSAVVSVAVFSQPPAITFQPSPLEVAVGRPLVLVTGVSQSESPSLQWFKDGAPIPGATVPIFLLPAAQFSDAGEYRFVASNPLGAATSEVARVTVVGLIIESGPYTPAPMLLSNNITLAIMVSSSVRVYYQWFFNGAPLPGETRPTLVFPALDFSQAGGYFVVATNSYASATSQVATVTVDAQPASVSLILSGGSPNRRFRIGDRVTIFANVYGGPPPALQWLHDEMAMLGQTSDTLSLTLLSTNDSGAYAIVASNSFGSVTSSPVVLEVVAEAPFFALVPGSTNQVPGSTVTLRAVAVAGPPPSYEWRRDGIALPGATNSMLLLTNLAPPDGGTYEVLARNGSGEARHSSLLAVRPSTGLDHWDWRRPRPQGSRLHGLAFGNGRYVAVGKSGNLIASSDGLNWSNLILEADCDLESVAFGNGRFIASGLIATSDLLLTNGPIATLRQVGLLLTSADGSGWTVAQPPAGNGDGLGQIAFGNGVFVACSRFGQAFAYTSPDGLNWTPLQQDDPANAVAWGNGRFVLTVGGRIYGSTDGTHWELVHSSPTLYFRNVAHGENGFLAASYYGENVVTSPDGQTWTERGPMNCQPQSLASGAGLWVAACNNPQPAGSLAVSADGDKWTIVDTGTAQEIESLIYAEGRFVAVGEAGTITTSPDGLSWSPSQAPNRIDYYALAHAGSLVVAAGDSGTVLTSTDGRSWTTRPTPTTRNLHAIHWADGLFVAGGRRGALITSPDGLVWTTRASGLANYVERISQANGLWVAVGEHGDLSTSPNGLSWVPQTTGPPFADHEGVAFGNGVWVAVGGYFLDPILENGAFTTIYLSQDALSWSRQPINLGVRLRDVAFAQGRFVAAGNDGAITTSTNGTEWASYLLGSENFRRVRYANGRFIVAGNNGALFSSPDPARADSWVPHRSHTSLNLHDLHAAADGTVYAVGNNGMILQSAGTLPRFTAIQPVPEGFRLELDPGLAGPALQLESSADLDVWTLLKSGAVSPVTVPATNLPNRFFRLAIP